MILFYIYIIYNINHNFNITDDEVFTSNQTKLDGGYTYIISYE